MIEDCKQQNDQQRKGNILNIVSSIVTLVITTAVSLILSPYIVKTMGVEANGFVTLANNFISYAMLAQVALNSMGSRYIMMSYYKGEYEKANKYYSSLFFGDLFLGVLFAIIAGFSIWQLENILQISTYLISDVKLLFLLLFANFIMNTIITVWSSAPYIKNRLYINSAISVIMAIVKAIVTFLLFIVLKPSIWFVGMGVFASGMVGFFCYFVAKKNLLPDFKVKKSCFSWSSTKELLSSGIWNAISSLGSILLSGMDLLLANLFLGPNAMGLLSLAKTMPSFVSTLNSTIANVFVPSLIIEYSQENKGEIIKTVKQSSKIIAMICSIPLAFLLVFGADFYKLWQPTENAQMLHLLSCITILGRCFFTGMEPLFHVFTVVNKVRQNSIITVITGCCSVFITFLLLKFTNLGVFAIAGTSVVCCFIKNIFYVIPYSAKYLSLRRESFYYTLLPSVLCCVILSALGIVLKLIVSCESWLNLIICAAIFAVVGMFFSGMVVLNKQDRKALIRLLRRR